MHSFYALAALLPLLIQWTSASFYLGGSNGDSQTGNEEAPQMGQTPVMYSAPVMTAVPVSPVVHYDLMKPRSQVRNLVGSYSKEEGHLSDTTLELPFRRARARKLAARKAARMHKKSLKKHRKVNKQ
ncbi:hypothetical protein Y032_0049g1790 [Ancylostoma ceylanicum]|uniref:Uncharacterized protein n=1 Tax=Ancylostoma ceylanicum TaxID=53326 RepID=A0A016UAD3_9BILA|nr:hypothetical protein Y032_0049g1790 [Ancylostoma ceylanicum]